MQNKNRPFGTPSFLLLGLSALWLATSAACSAPSPETVAERDELPGMPEGSATITFGSYFVRAPRPANRPLRHTVFFKFKEESTSEDIDGVVDAFKNLPNKIEEIVGFEWGENNSPEGLDDGFTHCFVLTFKNDSGRGVYLPHDAHRAFGDVLRPHMADVFVIDYLGRPNSKTLEEKLRHAVYLKFKDDASEEDIKRIESEFANLSNEIAEVREFEWGQNNSPEKHDDGFTHCFMLTFDSEEGRDTYLEHETHKAFVEQLTPLIDQARVLDYWARR